MIRNLLSFTLLLAITVNSINAEKLTGYVKYDGKPMPKISKTQLNKKMNADPVCGASHKEPVYMQWLIVNENKTLKNVLVYLMVVYLFFQLCL